jgi:hypothetical protein
VIDEGRQRKKKKKKERKKERERERERESTEKNIIFLYESPPLSLSTSLLSLPS